MSDCIAKFQVSEVTLTAYNKAQQKVILEARYDNSLEDRTFSEATPSAKLEMLVNNPKVKFEPGDFYYLHFEKIEKGE